MVFPADLLPVKVELQLAGVWTDVTDYTYTRDSLVIRRGRSDEASSFEPGECRLTLNNIDGRFSPRNPNGPYYGALTRNTPIRVSVLAGGVRLVGTTGADEATTPDSAGLSITGDIDLRVDAYLVDWSLGAGGSLMSKSLTAGQRSYRMGYSAVGRIFFEHSTDGTAVELVTSTLALPTLSGRQSIRATLDVDNGAAGHTLTFYYGPSITGPWTQLGTPVVTAGVTSIFNGNTALAVRDVGGGQGTAIYAVQVLQGIAGTVRANPDFAAQAEGATSFADGAGNTWTVSGFAQLTARRYRFYGEVPSWPQQWDISERDAWVPVQAAGVLRRLGQGTAALKSSIQRATLNDPNVRGYWPMEDQEGATSLASGLAGGPAMAIFGNPRLAASDVFPSSNPLPEMALAFLSGQVNTYVATGSVHARFMMAVPDTGETLGAMPLRLWMTGTAARWDLTYDPINAGALRLEAFDSAGVNIMSQAASFAVNGKLLAVVLELVQNGANIDWKVVTVDLGVPLGLQMSNTLNTRTVGQAALAQVNAGLLLDTTVIGHLAVASAIPASFEQPLNGYLAEKAGRRIERLCSEEGIPFTGYGDLDDSVAMGVQRPTQLLDLFAECEASDLGQLFESRDQLGLAYRTRASRAYQAAALALNYTALRELTPVEDDQNTRNDITVTRINGSSARATIDTGPLSTQAPPNGVGRYDDVVELSLASDTQLASQANLRATLGTIDEPRYPVLSVQLAGTAFAASQALISSALDVEHGDLITVTGTPVWVPPGTIEAHTIGQVETLGVREYQIDYVCMPARPIGATGLYDSTAARWGADSSTLNATMTTSATSVTVATATGPLWTTTDVPLDIVVAGERITVGAISGATSPQTFSSLTRSVNGVVKAHSVGEAVQIADPDYYAL